MKSSEPGKDFDANQERLSNPSTIYIKKYGGNDAIYINRESRHGIYNYKDEKAFEDSRGPEAKEFLEYIGHPNWYSENFKTFFGRGDFKAVKEFNDEIIYALQDVEIRGKPVWQVIKPLTFEK